VASFVCALSLLVGVGLNVAASGQASTKIKIGESYPFIGISPFFGVESFLTVQAAKAAGFDALAPANANSNTATQIGQVHTLVSEGVKGIILVPEDSNAIGPAVDYAVSHGVSVVGQDVGVNDPKVAMNVRVDNVQMGVAGCQYIGKAVHGTGDVLDIAGTLSIQNGLDRKNGFDNCIKKNYPHINLITHITDFSGTQAAAVLQTVLVQYPHLKALFMASDSNMTAAVVQVLKEKGKLTKIGTANHIVAGGVDGGGPYGLQEIRAGYVDFTIEQPVTTYTAQAVAYLKLAIAGKKFHPGPDGHGGSIVSQNGVLEDFVPSKLVTIKNASDPQLWGNSAVAKKLFP